MKILDIYKNPFYTLYQWDINQFVNIIGINPEMPVSVQFWRAGQSEAFVVESTVSGNTVTAAIPNELLREPGELVIYIWQDTGAGEQKGGRTETFFNIPIKERAQPSDYIYDDNVEYISVKTVIEDAKNATTAAQEATEAATSAAKLANDTAEDIKQKADSGEFNGEKGDKGDKGDTGQIPDILINATVNNTVGTPSVSIEKTGTLENPVFNLSFENLKGEQGQKGTNGKDGAPGAQGEPGQPGADGKSATITIGEVKTVESDNPATVTNTGNETDAIFNFEIPRGKDGQNAEIDLDTIEKVAIKNFIEGNPAMSGSSSEWRIPLIEGYGESTQVTTTGKNLLQGIELGGFDDSGNPTANTGAYRNVNEYIKVTPNKFLMMSCKTGTIIIKKAVFYDSEKAFIKFDQTRKPQVPENAEYCNIQGPLSDITNAENLQLELMDAYTAPTSYEPYTGGAPSPSPEYPQEIKDSVVTTVKLTGKNLFKMSQAKEWTKRNIEYIQEIDNGLICKPNGTYAACKSNLFKLNPNTNYSLSAYIESDNLHQSIGMRLFKNILNVPDTSRQVAAANRNPVTSENVKVNANFVTDELEDTDEFYLQLDCSWQTDDVSEVEFTKIQIEYGATATEYEPYKEQSIPLSAPVTLRGIPSESGNVTIDGQKYLSDVIDKEKITRHVGYIASYNGEDVGDLYMSTTGQLTTGATVIYALAEPTTELLPPEDVQALADLKTFYPSSVINWETEDNAGAWTRAEIVHDPANYIDEKISSAVTQAITLAQGGNI